MPTDSAFECFVHGTSTQIFGVPVALPSGSTNGLQGGMSFAGARILVGYDRQRPPPSSFPS